MSSVPASQAAQIIFKRKRVSIILNMDVHWKTWPSCSHRVLIMIIALTTLCPGPRTSSTRPPSSWLTRRSWVWRRRWRRTSWRTTSSTFSPTYSLARPSPWRNLSSCRKPNLFHLFQGRDGDLPFPVHRRPLHDHPDYSLQPLLPRYLAWGSTAGVWWDCWTGGHYSDDDEDYPNDGDDYVEGYDQSSWWWWWS